MCLVNRRYGPIGDFFGIEGISPVDPAELQPFLDERKRQLEAEPQRGLRPGPSYGWHCPNCGSAHAPDVATCPEPPRGGSLRERLKAARS